MKKRKNSKRLCCSYIVDREKKLGMLFVEQASWIEECSGKIRKFRKTLFHGFDCFHSELDSFRLFLRGISDLFHHQT